LGTLKQFSGKVQFPIPVGTNPADYNGVVIWCKKFSVEIGHAAFAKQTMMDDRMMKKDEMTKDGMMNDHKMKDGMAK
jgi:hypothetical protein